MAKPKSKSDDQAAPPPELAQNELGTFTARTLHQLRPHATKILAVLGGVVLVVLGLTIYQNMAEKKAAAASRSFSEVVTKATSPVVEGGPQIDLSDLDNPQMRPPKTDIKTFAERTQLATAAMADLQAKYGSTPVGKSAAIVGAGLALDMGKFDDAQKSYQAFLDTRPPADLAARAREGIGYALEGKALAQTDAAARGAGLDEAFRAFGAIDPDDKGAFHGLGLYHQARIAALKGDKKAAIDLYKKALEKEPASDLTEQINSRLSLLEAK